MGFLFGRRLINAAGVAAFFLMLSGTAFASGSTAPAPLGSLTARIQDQDGQPLANILISFLAHNSDQQIPILARTNAGGLVFLKDIAIGSYRVLAKNTRFRQASENLVEVLPGRTQLVTVVLQQLLGVQVSEERNMGVKALLRTSAHRRLVFRSQPGVLFEEARSHEGGRAVLQVYSNSGLGGDYLVFPGDSAAGTATNFAIESALGANGTSVLAGQLNSGEDSLWRLKNFINYRIGSSHDFRVLLGYGRLNFSQTASGVSGAVVAGSEEFSQVDARLKTLSFGVEDGWRIAEGLSVTWGLEFDRVRVGGRDESFVSPNAEVKYSAGERTDIRVTAASKRITRGNTLSLPSGDSVNLSSAVFISNIDDDFRLGTARHYEAAVTRKIGEGRKVEVAAFDNDYRGFAQPFATQAGLDGSEIGVLQLQGSEADTSGLRFTYGQQLGSHLTAAVSYIYGSAVGIESDREVALVDERAIRSLIRRQTHHAVSTRIDARIPLSRTTLTALVSFVPASDPLPTLDAYNDLYETSNEGVNLFVRQIVPLHGVLGFIGLDFLTPQHVEALLDIRNLTNEDVGSLSTAHGDVALLRSSPRTFRGGISVKF